MLKLEHPWQVFVLMAVGASCLTLGDFALKQALLSGLTLQQVFGIGPIIFQFLLVILAVFSAQGWRQHLWLKHPKLMFVRGLFGLIFTSFAFYSLSVNPYSLHAMLMQTGPVIASLLAIFALGEIFTKRILVVSLISLCGVGLIIGPSIKTASWLLLLPLVAAASNAASNILVARYRDHATGIGFTFWSSWLVSLLGFAWWLSDGAPTPNAQGLAYLVLMSVLMVIALVCISNAMGQAARFGVASRVTLMMYVQTPVALFFGVVFLHESLTWVSLLGASVILAAGTWMMLSKGKPNT